MEQSKDNNHLTCFVASTKDKEVLQIISTLRDLFGSCYGPQGKAKIIINSCGSHIALTSSSQRIMDNMNFSHPFSKLVKTSIQQHLRVFADGGLYMGLMTLSLVENALKSEIPPMLCGDIFVYILDICNNVFEYFNYLKLDIGNSKIMIDFVRTIIEPKSICCLKLNEIDIIASLVVQSFLRVLSAEDGCTKVSPQLEYKVLDGLPVSNSCLKLGVFVEIPRNHFLHKNDFEKVSGMRCKVALFKLSVASDNSSYPEVTVEGGVNVNAKDALWETYSLLVNRLVELKVGLVCCQRVLHPSFKKLLRHHEIVFLERLASTNIEAVQRVTGCKPFSSLHPSNICREHLGENIHIQLVCLCRKNFVCLQSENSNICTVFLCHRSLDSLEELKHVFSVAHSSLHNALRNPKVLPGAGCFEILFASEILKKVRSISPHDIDELGCSKSQFISGTDCFIRSLEHIASLLHSQSHYKDTLNNHLWVKDQDQINSSANTNSPPDEVKRCACGLTQAKDDFKLEESGEDGRHTLSTFIGSETDIEDLKLDLACVKESAIKMAVEVADMILRTGVIIHEND